MSSQQSKPWQRAMMDGAVHTLPLNLAVIPWGILAGSMAIETGLSFWQSIAMSAMVFAGAAQLVTLGLLNSGAGYITIVISVFFITSQHLLYGLTMRPYVKDFTTPQRLSIGFLLTDELFAISAAKRQALSFAYLFGAGFSFYLVWFITSLCGIVMANLIGDLSKLHLDFSVVATLLAIVVPLTRKISTACGVLFSLIVAITLSMYSISSAIVIAGVGGMFVSVGVSRVLGEEK
ncbi:branched-chain amino acid ABC transporter permease [Providencia alcalifaciens]|uniref:Putative azaleucine resistance protein AzlC n=1 Tax=Providencia alcalifaciens DSM 30120 TaxID=520999 RepID=B6XHT0_9GAMM|nr:MULTISPECIES: AzlC family ABC transporter permease [Providencia]ATG17505.1 branched-chain amino acid ABC transporter permease [Providencia alcalifaciens]EEB44893.1 putative azaleucine resistance protein AzlC [Providencia alcalifaciens DSM 30120]ETT05299.1 AzlC protein [Providencia alcalifaciens F90-2004]EUC94632.1 AzlC protein [Providencia alcalifaciens PAL-2]MTB33624.1 branched-chain amino acid ABC transporter permease [Providencia alcalifaciens]